MRHLDARYVDDTQPQVAAMRQYKNSKVRKASLGTSLGSISDRKQNRREEHTSAELVLE
jgi:hypothetical protein